MFKRLLYVFFILGLVGCSAPSGSEVQGEGDNNLKVAYNAQPENLDPHLSNTSATNDISRTFFEPLLALDENKEVAPVLAESYEESEDQKKITFHLREGVKFHNGEEMTANDVVASMERWKNLSGKASALFSESEFVKEDEYTVVLEMDKPLTIAQYVLAMSTNFAAIMPEEIVKNIEEGSPVKEYVGTGPFEFVEWNQDRNVIVKKNEAYASPEGETSGLVGKREALVEQITFEFVQDSSTRTAGIQTGEYDLALNIPFDSKEQLSNDANVQVHINPVGYLTVIFNKKEGLFTDEKARQAVNLAVNKESVMTSAFTDEEFYELDQGLVPTESASWHADSGREGYEAYDPERAKQLLEEAGYNGEKINILTTRDYEDYYNGGIVVQQELEAIGVDVELEVYDWPSLLERRTDPSAYDMYMMGFFEATDPTQVQYLDSRYNFPGWTNHSTFDDLLDDLMVAPTEEEAKEIFEQVQGEAWTYLPAIKFGNYRRPNVTRQNVSGFEFFQGPILWNVEKE